MKKTNDSFEWTEQKLKKTWIRYHVLKKSAGYESVSFGLLPEPELEPKTYFFSAPAPAKNYGCGRLRLRNTGKNEEKL